MKPTQELNTAINSINTIELSESVASFMNNNQSENYNQKNYSEDNSDIESQINENTDSHQSEGKNNMNNKNTEDSELIARKEATRLKYACNTIVSDQPPCSHNDWDNVRVIKKHITLRCRVCQIQWRTKIGSAWRRRKCAFFNRPQGCTEGVNCKKIHIHSKKQTKEERMIIRLKDVIEELPLEGSDGEDSNMHHYNISTSEKSSNNIIDSNKCVSPPINNAINNMLYIRNGSENHKTTEKKETDDETAENDVLLLNLQTMMQKFPDNNEKKQEEEGDKKKNKEEQDGEKKKITHQTTHYFFDNCNYYNNIHNNMSKQPYFEQHNKTCDDLYKSVFPTEKQNEFHHNKNKNNNNNNDNDDDDYNTYINYCCDPQYIISSQEEEAQKRNINKKNSISGLDLLLLGQNNNSKKDRIEENVTKNKQKEIADNIKDLCEDFSSKLCVTRSRFAESNNNNKNKNNNNNNKNNNNNQMKKNNNKKNNKKNNNNNNNKKTHRNNNNNNKKSKTNKKTISDDNDSFSQDESVHSFFTLENSAENSSANDSEHERGSGTSRVSVVSDSCALNCLSVVDKDYYCNGDFVDAVSSCNNSSLASSVN